MFQWNELAQQVLAFVQGFGIWAFLLTVISLIARTGLLPGSILPGGVLVFSTGFVATQWPLVWIPAAIFCLTLASSFGSWIGFAGAQRLLASPRCPKCLRPSDEALHRATERVSRFGYGAVALAVTQPWLCSICPYVAVRLGLDRSRFVLSSAFGSLLWVTVIFAMGNSAGRAAALSMLGQ